VENLFQDLIRPGVLLKTLTFKWDPHSFNIKKLKYNDIKLLIVLISGSHLRTLRETWVEVIECLLGTTIKKL